eukprot:298082-Chlamydomonas_euryale.AAC.1
MPQSGHQGPHSISESEMAYQQMMEREQQQEAYEQQQRPAEGTIPASLQQWHKAQERPPYPSSRRSSAPEDAAPHDRSGSAQLWASRRRTTPAAPSTLPQSHPSMAMPPHPQSGGEVLPVRSGADSDNMPWPSHPGGLQAPQQSWPNSVMALQQSRPSSVTVPQQSRPNSVMAPQQSRPNS